MKRIRKTEITWEMQQVSTLRWQRASPQRWCPQCAALSQMLTPEVSAQLCGVSPRVVYRRVEAGTIHFTETEDGALFVCLASLQAILAGQTTHHRRAE